MDPSGEYFTDSYSIACAEKLENLVTARINSLMFEQVSILNKKNPTLNDKIRLGEINSRLPQLNGTLADVESMRDNEDMAFTYKEVIENPTTVQENGVYTMYYQKDNIGTLVHETRHGGDISRGTLKFDTKGGYNVNHEVSAYQAQFSYDGKLQLPVELSPENILKYKSDRPIIYNYDQITPSKVNEVWNRKNDKPLYPPTGITIDVWNNRQKSF